jgi:hypothetical protein
MRCTNDLKTALRSLDTNLERLQAIIFDETAAGGTSQGLKTFKRALYEYMKQNKPNYTPLSKHDYMRHLFATELPSWQKQAARYVGEAETILLETRAVLEDAARRRKDNSVSFFVLVQVPECL